MISMAVVLGILLVCAAAALLGFLRCEAFQAFSDAVNRRPALFVSIWLIALLALNLIPVLVLGLPVPSIHDEFSYLLGADTFARGRWTNPPLQNWENFETFYVQMQPTYASMYPPGSAALMGLSQALTGHPYWAVLAVNMVLALAVTWALSAWVSFPIAFLVSTISSAAISCTYWTHSYWGGSLAALLSLLLVGAMGRIHRPAPAILALVLGAAAAGLGFVRPFEGAGLVAAVLVYLLLKDRRAALWLPLLVVLAAGLALFCYYNFRVTGDVLLHPYLHYLETYVGKSLLRGQEERTISYRHLELELMLSTMGLHSSPAQMVLRKFFAGAFPFRPLSGVLLLAVGFLAAWTSRTRIFAILLIVAAGTAAAANYSLPHYLAPHFGVVTVLVAVGFERLLAWRPRGRALGMALALGVLLGSWFSAADAFYKMLSNRRDLRFLTRTLGVVEYPPYSMNYAPDSPVRTAELVRARLKAIAGPHLVFVRYNSRHDPQFEWVYNSADLASQDVIWARAYTPQSRNRLRAEFPNHRCWILEPDLRPYLLEDCGPF